jgi:uncharacterized membrane protein YdbT with pleckstrin-like domain
MAVAAVIVVSKKVPAAAADALALVLLVVLGWLLVRYVRWRSINFVLTSQRLIHRSGVLAKHGREIPLDHINDISYHQSIIERVVGAGDLVIESAGERGQTRLSDIPKPSLVQNEVYRQIEACKARAAGRDAAARGISIPEQIEKLAELRERGVITDSEFEAKKAQLLDRL